MLDRETYLQAITADGETLILDASMSGNRDVPTCPGWTVEKLLRHVTGLLGWVAASVDRAPDEVAQSDLPIPPKGHDLFPVAEGALAAAVDALRAVDPSALVNSWAGPVPAMWWCRRLAHELAIHRADGQLAVSGGEAPSAIEPALAVDGIDEVLELFAPLRFDATAFSAQPMTAHLHATDVEGEWFIRLGERLEVTHEHAKGDLAIRGTASSLMFVLWNRRAHQDIETFGEPELVDRLVSVTGA
jgi:uncharacterized protein (TIGR03083 family)